MILFNPQTKWGNWGSKKVSIFGSDHPVHSGSPAIPIGRWVWLWRLGLVCLGASRLRKANHVTCVGSSTRTAHMNRDKQHSTGILRRPFVRQRRDTTYQSSELVKKCTWSRPLNRHYWSPLQEKQCWRAYSRIPLLFWDQSVERSQAGGALDVCQVPSRRERKTNRKGKFFPVRILNKKQEIHWLGSSSSDEPKRVILD